MKGTQEGVKAVQGDRSEEGKIPLVLYKIDTRYRISPPATVKIFWFWTPEPPSSLAERGALREIETRLGDFCGEEGKKVKAVLFFGVKNGREEGLILVTVQTGKEFFSEQEEKGLMMNAPEPPRRYPPLPDEPD